MSEDSYICGECGPVAEDAEEHRNMHRMLSTLSSDLLGASGAPVSWWWLSFCDPSRPKGTQFLGVCIVDGWDILSAVRRSHELGCNPGGEVAAWPLQGWDPDPEWREAWCNRLLAKAEAESVPEP